MDEMWVNLLKRSAAITGHQRDGLMEIAESFVLNNKKRDVIRILDTYFTKNDVGVEPIIIDNIFRAAVCLGELKLGAMVLDKINDGPQKAQDLVSVFDTGINLLKGKRCVFVNKFGKAESKNVSRVGADGWRVYRERFGKMILSQASIDRINDDFILKIMKAMSSESDSNAETMKECKLWVKDVIAPMLNFFDESNGEKGHIDRYRMACVSRSLAPNTKNSILVLDMKNELVGYLFENILPFLLIPRNFLQTFRSVKIDDDLVNTMWSLRDQCKVNQSKAALDIIESNIESFMNESGKGDLKNLWQARLLKSGIAISNGRKEGVKIL